MKKIVILFIVFLLATTYTQAQFQKKSNTFGGFSAGITTPQGDFKTNYDNGFQITGDINARIYKPLWFYVEAEYENLPVNTAGTAAQIQSISTAGGGVGLKLFPLKFLYFNAGAGIRGVVSGAIINADNSSVYFNVGGGLYLLKFLGVFAGYTIWQPVNSGGNYNYMVAGVKLSFGRK